MTTPETLETLVSSWDGNQVLVRHHGPSGSWIFVCMHSRVLGPWTGGTRMKVYDSPAEALRDGMRLAEGMTVKFTVSGLPFGGGKAVLAVPEIPTGPERTRLLRGYADAISSLGGNFWTGCDMNTTPADLDVIAETCPYVFGRSVENGGSGEPGPFTARGVFHGIKASLAHALGSSSVAGRTVLVQGVGSVGASLAELLADAGAELILSDVLPERATSLAERLGARTVEPEQALDTACDVYAPCATGGTISRETIPRLRCRVVAGSANNQLAAPEDADALASRGILYAPDFVVNAGGALYNAGSETLGWDEPRIADALRAIGTTLTLIFEQSVADGVSTGRAAEELASRRLRAEQARLP